MSSRRAVARLLLAVALAGFAATAVAQDAPIPAFEGFVTDQAHVLPDDRRAQLEAFLKQLQDKTGAQFAVLTVPTTGTEEPDAYKTRVFKAWGIGGAKMDEGLLLLVAIEQRRLVFETGYGLEGTLPDGWQSTMLRELAIPRFRAGDPAGGITAAVLAAAQRIAAEKGVTLTWNGEELRYSSSRRKDKLPNWVVLLILFFAFFVVLPAIRANSGGRGRRGPGWYGGWGGGGFGGFGGGFGGGGGSSFGGFGGGSSGGGGGGGSW